MIWFFLTHLNSHKISYFLFCKCPLYIGKLDYSINNGPNIYPRTLSEAQSAFLSRDLLIFCVTMEEVLRRTASNSQNELASFLFVSFLQIPTILLNWIPPSIIDQFLIQEHCQKHNHLVVLVVYWSSASLRQKFRVEQLQIRKKS